MRPEVFGLPRKIRYYTNDEQVALLAKYKAGDISARNKLLESQYHYIVKLANINKCNRYTMEDVIQDAIIGAIRAIDRWDPTRGSLASVLFYGVRLETVEAISKNETLVSMPARYLNYRSTIIKEDDPEKLKNIMHQFRLSTKNRSILKNMMTAHSSLDSIALSAPNGIDKTNVLHDRRIRFEEQAIENIERAEILRALSGAPEQKQKIIKLYFGFGCEPHTMEQVAKKMGMTRQNVDQHLQWVRKHFKTNEKLRSMVTV